MTLREYIIFWQETYDKSQSRPTTYAAHHYVFKNHILPGLGDIPLSELTSEMVGEFLEERRRFGNHRPGSSGLGEETMRHIHRLLQQCLDQAIRDGLLTEKPAKAFRYRKSTTVKANIMTPLEMEDYLDAAERLGYLPMFMLALKAGLRQGELFKARSNAVFPALFSPITAVTSLRNRWHSLIERKLSIRTSVSFIPRSS